MHARTHAQSETLKRKRGRPKSESPREIVWPLRFSKDEAKRIDAASKGKPRGEWIREILLSAAT